AAKRPGGGALREARKQVARLERAIERLAEREHELHAQMAASATDHTRLGELQRAIELLVAEREALEADWMASAEALE
ncbi:MAG: transport system ATP-binding/permease protein, partial [Solirubrobacteraceae bacterium]|nr:transport system ATP-binding/permease protein [Solirubrobacteraceae bacterium]